MKNMKNRKGVMWEYLNVLGVIENGTDEEIKAAKKAYRKEYYLRYKRNQRSTKPEFIINFSSNNGEYSKVKRAAERHKMTMTAFIRSTVLAYLDQRFVVPNADQLAHLEQILSQCLNEIQKLVGAKEKYYWSREEKFEAIEKRIEKLESDIDQVFRHPPLLKYDNQI
jgi:hypothetical protein